MKKIMNGLMILSVVISSSSNCSSVIPREKRVIENVLEVNLSKDEIINRASDTLAKIYVNSNSAIQVKDKERGVIIGKAIAKCETLNNLYTLNGDYFEIEFNLELTAKDKKYRLIFEDIDLYIVRRQQWNSKDRSYGFSEEDLMSIDKNCISSIRDRLVNAIEKKRADF
jgi:hypothetical protein